MVFHWNDFKRFRSELMFKQNCEIVVDVSDETPDDEIPIPNRFKGRIKKIPFEKIAMDYSAIQLWKCIMQIIYRFFININYPDFLVQELKQVGG